MTPTETPAETELSTVASMDESLSAATIRSPWPAVVRLPLRACALAPPSTVLVAITRFRPTSPAETSLSSSAAISVESVARSHRSPPALAFVPSSSVSTAERTSLRTTSPPKPTELPPSPPGIRVSINSPASSSPKALKSLTENSSQRLLSV